MDDDPYCYPGTEVLRNKPGLRDPAALQAFERQATRQRGEGLRKPPLTPDGLCAVHRHIFQDVYEWAGEFRSVDLSKETSLFCRPAYIGAELDKEFARLPAPDDPRGATADRFAELAARHVAELNAIHPFREGNGRAIRYHLVYLAERAGHTVDLGRIDEASWRRGSIESMHEARLQTLIDAIRNAIM